MMGERSIAQELYEFSPERRVPADSQRPSHRPVRRSKSRYSSSSLKRTFRRRTQAIPTDA